MRSIHSTESPLRRGSRLYGGIVAAALLFTTHIIAAQQSPAPAGSPTAPAAKKSPRHRARPEQETPPAPQVQAAPAPPQPETPPWPVNETPVKPSVTWDSHGLRIEANNASLHDILNEVSTDTGAKVEGMSSDERVFGEYGPGAARDVLAQLLHGSNYNVLMIGDQGEGTPRQIVLSARRAGTAANANRPNQDQSDDDFVPDEPQADDQPVQPPVMTGRPPMQMVPPGPPGAPRTPQQVLQELQQRQQQLQEQQQQQQQQPQQQQPQH
jgi:hypothetical protein